VSNAGLHGPWQCSAHGGLRPGRDDYYDRARKECLAYIGLLRRTVGEEPGGASLRVKSNPHDFGSYLSVVCYFDPDVAAAVDYAFRCESASPQAWDEVARTELGLNPNPESPADSERQCES
jgi:hypothetical protein